MGSAFVYGTLMVPNIVSALLKRQPVTEKARLSGYARYRVRDALFPAIVPEASSSVDGMVLLGLSKHELAILDDYEGVALNRAEYEADEYYRQLVDVQLANGEWLAVHVYIWQEKYRSRLEEGVYWDFDAFLANDLKKYWHEELEAEYS